MTEIIFETDKVFFEKTSYKKRCKVVVRSKKHNCNYMVYRYNKIDNTLKSQYISWANLNCCNGWIYDESYLMTAVQDGNKLCAGISFNSQNDREDYIQALSQEYCYCRCAVQCNGSSWGLDLCRIGVIGDYIDMKEVVRVYKELGLSDNYNIERVFELASTPMIELLDGTANFDYANSVKIEEVIIAGLLLGYPLESTASILFC